MTADQWQQLGGLCVPLIAALIARKKQNKDLLNEQAALAKGQDENRKAANRELAESLAEEVSTIKTVLGIHKDELRIATAKIAVLSHQFERIEKCLPEVKDVCEKAINFFERKQTTNLEAHPIAGSGGKVVIKKKEEK